jgi:hypothetical protein
MSFESIGREPALMLTMLNLSSKGVRFASESKTVSALKQNQVPEAPLSPE